MLQKTGNETSELIISLYQQKVGPPKPIGSHFRFWGKFLILISHFGGNQYIPDSRRGPLRECEQRLISSDGSFEGKLFVQNPSKGKTIEKSIKLGI